LFCRRHERGSGSGRAGSRDNHGGGSGGSREDDMEEVLTFQNVDKTVSGLLRRDSLTFASLMGVVAQSKIENTRCVMTIA